MAPLSLGCNCETPTCRSGGRGGGAQSLPPTPGRGMEETGQPLCWACHPCCHPSGSQRLPGWPTCKWRWCALLSGIRQGQASRDQHRVVFSPGGVPPSRLGPVLTFCTPGPRAPPTESGLPLPTPALCTDALHCPSQPRKGNGAERNPATSSRRPPSSPPPLPVDQHLPASSGPCSSPGVARGR